MKLIIKEYLTLLKESEELDALLPDLLLSMGIIPLNKAQIGVRQNGVDIAAAGKDKNGTETLFLFVIKRGDIGRTDWNNASPQSIRPTLDEIEDVYLNKHVAAKHKKLPQKIVLCTGGDLKQEVKDNWEGYVRSKQVDGIKEYDFWGGDVLSVLLEKYMFNEHILPANLKTKFRKVLALLSDQDYSLEDYYEILEDLLLKTDLSSFSKTTARKKAEKILRTVHLCQNIIFLWAQSENNLKPALLCSERTILNSWHFIIQNNLDTSPKVIEIFHQIYTSLIKVHYEYFLRVQPYCQVPESFSRYGAHPIQVGLNVYEHLGFMTNAAVLFMHYGVQFKQEGMLNDAFNMIQTIKSFISNHACIKTPYFDDHIIEISSAIFLLQSSDEIDFIKYWLTEIVNSISFAYRYMGKYFPIQSDSFDDLVDLCILNSVKKEVLFEISTLLPILSQWCIALGLEETYNFIQKNVQIFFSECNCQIWYPDHKSDDLLYRKNSSSLSGATEAKIDMNLDWETMIKRIKEVQDKTIPLSSLTAIKNGLLPLIFIACRHFRTPPLPQFWQNQALKEKDEETA